MSHALHVIGADDGGAIFHLECVDKGTDCEANGEQCSLASWWDEVGSELIDREGLAGPPPWNVYPHWGYDDSPVVKQVGYVLCEGSGASMDGYGTTACPVCGTQQRVWRDTVNKHNRPEATDA